MKKPFFILTLACLAAISSRAQLIDSYNGDTLIAGTPVTVWADSTGTAVATSAAAGTGTPFAANTDAAFNGHTYVSFGNNQGLATASALFTGGNPRSIAAVYTNPIGDNHAVNPVAGETQNGIVGQGFVIQSRDSGVSGDPYLAAYVDDTTNNLNPLTDTLTFALATYDGTTETLYYAFGNGAVNSVSSIPNPSLNTVANKFTFGYDYYGEPSQSDLNLGYVQVFDASLTSAQATDDIHSLQEYYGVPEPSTYALLGAALLGGLMLMRRRAQD